MNKHLYHESLRLQIIAKRLRELSESAPDDLPLPMLDTVTPGGALDYVTQGRGEAVKAWLGLDGWTREPGVMEGEWVDRKHLPCGLTVRVRVYAEVAA